MDSHVCFLYLIFHLLSLDTTLVFVCAQIYNYVYLHLNKFSFKQLVFAKKCILDIYCTHLIISLKYFG